MSIIRAVSGWGVVGRAGVGSVGSVSTDGIETAGRRDGREDNHGQGTAGRQDAEQARHRHGQDTVRLSAFNWRSCERPTRTTQSEIVERVLAAYRWRLPSELRRPQPEESSTDPADRAAWTNGSAATGRQGRPIVMTRVSGRLPHGVVLVEAAEMVSRFQPSGTVQPIHGATEPVIAWPVSLGLLIDQEAQEVMVSFP
jgi:hypothetical protein